MVLALVVNIHLAKVLSPEGFGIFAIAQSLIFNFLIFSDWGQNFVGVRRVAAADESEQSTVLAEIISFKVLLAVALVVLYFIVIYVFYHAFWLVLAVSAMQLVAAPFILDWFFQARRSFGTIVFRQVFTAVSFFLCSLLFINESGQVSRVVFFYNLTIVGSVLLVFVYFLRKSRFPHLRLDLRKVVERFRESNDVFFGMVVTTLSYNLSFLLLGMLNQPTPAAVYNTYYRLFASIVAPAIITYNIFLPRLLQQDAGREYARYLFILLNTAFMIVIGVLVWGQDVYLFLYAGKYDFSMATLLVFGVLILVHFLNYFFLYSLPVGKRDRWFLWVLLVGFAVQASVMVVLVMRNAMHDFNIALGLLTSESVVMVLSTFLYYKLHGKLYGSIIGSSVILFVLFAVAGTYGVLLLEGILFRGVAFAGLMLMYGLGLWFLYQRNVVRSYV